MASMAGLQIDIALSFDASRRNPQLPRRTQRIDGLPAPPGLLVTEAMIVPVMRSAKRHGEFVPDLASQRAGLSEPQVVSIGRNSAAYQTGVRSDKPEVGLVAMSARLADQNLALLDFAGSRVGLKMSCVRRDDCGRWCRWHQRYSRLVVHRFNLSGAPPLPHWLDDV